MSVRNSERITESMSIGVSIDWHVTRVKMVAQLEGGLDK